MTLKKLFASALLTMALSLCAFADPIHGPQYPAQGGNTFTGVGNSIDAGGLTETYTLTDTSAYGTQWWSLAVLNPSDTTAPLPPGDSNDYFAGEIGNTNQYSWGVQPLDFYDPTAPTEHNGFITILTGFTLTINSGLTYDAAASSQVGELIDGVQVPLFQVTGNNFSVNLQYYGVSAYSTFTDLADAYNSYNRPASCNGSCLQTGTDDSFFYTDPPTQTPEPSSIALLGTGIVGFAGFARRKIIRSY
jgi:hypothetical protein